MGYEVYNTKKTERKTDNVSDVRTCRTNYIHFSQHNFDWLCLFVCTQIARETENRNRIVSFLFS